jgi:hypothetical protein
MINGSDLRDFYINAWRNIPDLVAAVLDDPGRIRVHTGIARIAKSLQREVTEMPEGSIFVAYQGFKPGNLRRNEIIKHEIAAFIRAATPDDDAHIQFGSLMFEGIPTGEDLPVRDLNASDFLGNGANVESMDLPTFERASAAQLTIDIWHFYFTVPEYE